MKKKYALVLLVFMFLFKVQAQDADAPSLPQNEIKLNAFNLIALAAFDFGYERILNEESSFGVDIFIRIDDDSDFSDFQTFAITPYYRQYFSNKYAKGFFVEGFASLNSGREENFLIDVIEEVDYTDFALGISIGGKFVTPRGFVTEIFIGIGRNLLNDNFSPEIIGRGGVSIGYRF